MSHTQGDFFMCKIVEIGEVSVSTIRTPKLWDIGQKKIFKKTQKYFTIILSNLLRNQKLLEAYHS